MITGPNGFLYSQLDIQDSDDLLFLLGSPTTNDKTKLDNYVTETKDLVIKNKHKYIVFASSAWVDQTDDYYNKSKKQLEEFIKQVCTQYLILRIADIISVDKEKIKMMKEDRVQQQIFRNNLSEIPLKSFYLDLNIFIAETQHAIRSKDVGVHNYNLVELTVLELKNYAN